jgi:hypothetical protein
MYRGFELDIIEWELSSYREVGIKLYEKFRPKVTSVLDEYLKENKVLDGDKMREDWFPLVKADIFISHSHADIDLAINLAGWLYTHFRITAFIDSMIWGYANELLKQIDAKYCMDSEKKIYYYSLRNNSTSHIHIMLSTALTKIIDKIECFFFIKTNNSITTERAINEAGTYSPWIYSEIEMSRLVRKKSLKHYRQISDLEMKTFSERNKKFLNENFKIEHLLNLDHLVSVKKNNLVTWKNQIKIDKLKFPLDQLYINHPLPKRLEIL